MLNKDILASIQIHEIGDTKAVIKALQVLKATGTNAIAVRDADIGDDPASKIFSFPGSQPPEKEVFENDDVRGFINNKYDIDIKWLLTQAGTNDHHKISKIIATKISSIPDVVATFAIEKYVTLNKEEFSDLVSQISENTFQSPSR